RRERIGERACGTVCDQASSGHEASRRSRRSWPYHTIEGRAHRHRATASGPHEGGDGLARPLRTLLGEEPRPPCLLFRGQGSQSTKEKTMTSLTLVRRIKARPSIVFEALTTPEGITSWWGPDAGPVLLAVSDARVGGTYRVRFRMLDGSEHESAGEYLEVVPPRRLVMSWQWVTGGEPDEVGHVSRLEIDLRPIEIGTEITLTHARLATETSRASHERGWTGSVDKLVRRFDKAAEARNDAA